MELLSRKAILPLIVAAVLFGFGILASRYTHVVSNVPNYMMFGTVMILCVFGSYCVQNSFDDVLIMFSLGALMLLFKKLGIPSAPIVLASSWAPGRRELPAGQLIANTDVGLWQYFFSGTLNQVLIGLCVLSLAYASSARSALPAGPRPGSPASKRRPPMLGNSLPLWS